MYFGTVRFRFWLFSLYVGQPCQNFNEKTIMLVGATGSGKSTLVDGIINYIMGVNFEDPFRFKMVVLEKEERKTGNQVSTTCIILLYFVFAPCRRCFRFGFYSTRHTFWYRIMLIPSIPLLADPYACFACLSWCWLSWRWS